MGKRYRVDIFYGTCSYILGGSSQFDTLEECCDFASDNGYDTMVICDTKTNRWFTIKQAKKEV